MKIFIGTSTLHLVGKSADNKTNLINETNLNAKNSIAFQIQEKYKSEKDIEIKPWWDRNIIKPGSDFFRRILDLSNICDFGIFILSKDNQIENDMNTISNDNVYIELGVYIANKGLENSLFILEKGVKRPSDFSGLNVVTYDFDNDADIILSYIDEKIKSKRNNIKNYIDYQLFINKRTNDKIFENKLITKNWKSKAAYIGLDSAKTWYSIESNPDYLPGEYREKLKKFINKELKPKVKSIQNIVSLGSGIGTLDTMIVEGINFDGLKYIPIEINPYLAYRALDNVMNSTLKSINSFAIIDDFEEEIAQLGDFLNHHLVRKEESSLYIMLGATFGNIENPDSFLKAYSALIDNKDFFILDATTFNKSYTVQKDLDGRLKSKSVISMLIHCIEYKYQSNEEYRKSKRVKEFLSLTESERTNKLFEGNFVSIKTVDNRKQKRNVTHLYWFNFENSEITENIVISDNSILFKIKRYNNEALKTKIEDFFELEKFGDKNYFTIPVNGILDMSFYLMKRKPNQ